MKNRIFKNDGYIGLLALLITTVIIALLVWKLGFSLDKERSGEGVIQQDIQAIEQAKLLKNRLEQRDQQMIKE